MKKLLLSLLILLSISSVFAQTEQGKFLVGASSNLNFVTNSSRDFFDGEDVNRVSKANTYQISPVIGYFVADNISIGLALNLSGASTKFTSDFGENESKNNSFSISPFFKYYFTEGNFKPFFGGGVGLGTGKFERITNGFESKSLSVFFNLNAGVAYFINDKVSIELGLNYQRTGTSPNNGDEGEEDFITITNSFIPNVGFSLFL